MGGGGSKPSAPPPPPPSPPYVPDKPKKFNRGSPPANMELKIAKSASCDGCVFGIDVGVSSSMVILSRDILGKIAVPVVPVSDKWVWDDRVGFGDDGVPKLLQSSSDLATDCDGVGCNYIRADPSSWGTKWGDFTIDSRGNVGPLTKMNAAGIQKMFELDLKAWRADHQIAKLRKTSGKKVRMWNPSDDPDDMSGSHAINYANYGALTKLFLKPTLPFNVTFAPASAFISTMSVYQPFPLRVDSFEEKGKQYDACFQIGEFRSDNITGTSIVILVPLKVSPTPGVGGTFVNAFASKIGNILGQQPDPLLGYPDVPAQTGANWDVSKVVDTTRPYYTWKNTDGTRVIVMAEPILISEADMGNIQRLPVTPPEDIIHELPGTIQYKAAPPLDVNGNPVPCKNEVIARITSNVIQPPVAANKPAVSTDLWLQTILGIVGVLAIIIGVWFGLKLASGPVGEMLKKLGDSLGSSLAGGYGAIRRARSGTANVLGIGQNRPLPPPRTAEQIAATPAPAETPAAIADISPTFIPEPSSEFEMTNPMFRNRDDFNARHGTRRQRSRRIRMPTEIADISPKFIPEPTGDFEMQNPMFKSRDDFKSRHRTRKNRTPSQIADISPKFIPDVTGDFEMKNPMYLHKSDFKNRHRTQRSYPKVKAQDKVMPSIPPSADEIARRAAAEQNRQAQPAGTGLFDLGIPAAISATPPAPPRRSDTAPHKREPSTRVVAPPPLPSVAAVARATEPFPDVPAPTVRTPRRRNIAREPEDDDFIPPPPIPAAATASTRFLNELDRMAPVDPLSLSEHSTLENLSRTEETAEDRIARRARETALPRPPGMPTGPRRTSADTGLFGSHAMRAATGVREREDRTSGQNATIFGGKKRRHRMKTGRKF